MVKTLYDKWSEFERDNGGRPGFSAEDEAAAFYAGAIAALDLLASGSTNVDLIMEVRNWARDSKKKALADLDNARKLREKFKEN